MLALIAGVRQSPSTYIACAYDGYRKSAGCSTVRYYYRAFLCQLDLNKTRESELFLEDIIVTHRIPHRSK
jgi:hypothetical protein